SAHAPLLLAPPVGQHPTGREPSGPPENPRSGMRPGAAEVEALDRRRVTTPAGNRAHEQDLIEPQLAVGRCALVQTEPLLEISRRPRDPAPGLGDDVRR